jgi:hypothetical protein
MVTPDDLEEGAGICRRAMDRPVMFPAPSVLWPTVAHRLGLSTLLAVPYSSFRKTGRVA